MRNLLILAVVALTTAGCFHANNREQGPEARVQAFYKALSAGDFAQAQSLCDTLTMGGYIGEFRSAWESTDENIAAIVADILSETAVNITDTRKDGQKRTIFYTLTSADGQNKEKAAVLKSEEGEWKIEQITDRN
jgi:hypothetical protein